jgi:hypothetical protein
MNEGAERYRKKEFLRAVKCFFGLSLHAGGCVRKERRRSYRVEVGE